MTDEFIWRDSRQTNVYDRIATARERRQSSLVDIAEELYAERESGEYHQTLEDEEAAPILIEVAKTPEENRRSWGLWVTGVAAASVAMVLVTSFLLIRFDPSTDNLIASTSLPNVSTEAKRPVLGAESYNFDGSIVAGVLPENWLEASDERDHSQVLLTMNTPIELDVSTLALPEGQDVQRAGTVAPTQTAGLENLLRPGPEAQSELNVRLGETSQVVPPTQPGGAATSTVRVASIDSLVEPSESIAVSTTGVLPRGPETYSALGFVPTALSTSDPFRNVSQSDASIAVRDATFADEPSPDVVAFARPAEAEPTRHIGWMSAVAPPSLRPTPEAVLASLVGPNAQSVLDIRMSSTPEISNPQVAALADAPLAQSVFAVIPVPSEDVASFVRPEAPEALTPALRLTSLPSPALRPWEAVLPQPSALNVLGTGVLAAPEASTRVQTPESVDAAERVAAIGTLGTPALESTNFTRPDTILRAGSVAFGTPLELLPAIAAPVSAPQLENAAADAPVVASLSPLPVAMRNDTALFQRPGMLEPQNPVLGIASLAPPALRPWAVALPEPVVVSSLEIVQATPNAVVPQKKPATHYAYQPQPLVAFLNRGFIADRAPETATPPAAFAARKQPEPAKVTPAVWPNTVVIHLPATSSPRDVARIVGPLAYRYDSVDVRLIKQPVTETTVRYFSESDVDAAVTAAQMLSIPLLDFVPGTAAGRIEIWVAGRELEDLAALN